MIKEFPKSLKGIVFDLDGTLYHMRWFMKPMLTAKLAPGMLMLPRYMAVRKEFSGRDLQNGQALLTAMAKRLANASKTGTTESMLQWIHKKFYKAFISCMPFLKNSRPGISDVLNLLWQKDYYLGVLSDFACITERLAGLQIDQRVFHSLVSSESEGCLKPCPRPLQMIAQSWYLKPSEIVVIGDRDDTDGLIAEAAGMHFIKITDKQQTPDCTLSWSRLSQNLNALPEIKI